MRTILARLSLAAILLSPLTSGQAGAADVVNIYSYRQPDLIEPVLDAFTRETGIQTRLLFLDKGLEERIAAEGINSPADVLLSTDISKLVKAKEAGITQPVESDVIAGNIPSEYRDPDKEWFGITRRARVVYASKERVDADALSYADLARPEWKGRICIRSGQHDYNLALFGALIAHWGAEKTEAWMTGLRDNLARKPEGNDRAQAKGIYSGECDLALGNTYYVGLMMTNEREPEQKDWANAMKVIFPDIDGDGTHVNVSGMAMAKHAPNRDAALKLMEFLSGDEAQRVYAAQVFEYPVKPGVEASDIVQSFGALKADTLPLTRIAEERKAASEMVDRVGLDDGPQN
ncbi:iron ABC transporter substrate-binding protein [Zhengella mangrovi]|uniref:Iron ABC transporter substrate-binding protein n=1 Tax=Zhengella mangrovi TaxID=1982044 RepID=A0A2G1QLB2_9HYPH|nr:Fe(3+) ABC transporter substrate-binding protein [Zhengella mangrovi]PHP66259.1 iron ABC transporter substrate-binding protein [Zhengella mangrovi]